MLHTKTFDYIVMAIVLAMGVLYWGTLFHNVNRDILAVEQAEDTTTVIEKSDLPEGVAAK